MVSNAGFDRLKNVLNPFQTGKIDIVNPITKKVIYEDKGIVSGIVRNVVRAGEATLAIAGVSAVASKVSAVVSASSVPQITANTIGSSTFKTGSTLLSGVGYGVLGAGAGLVAGSLGSGKGGTSQPTQQTTPTQNINPAQQTNPIINTYNNQRTSTRTQNINYGSGSITSSSNQTPTLSTPTMIYPTQDLQTTQGTTAGQTSTGGSGGSTNWGMIALIGAGVYFLTRN